MKNLTNQRKIDKSVFGTIKAGIIDKFTQLVYNVRQGVTPKKVAKLAVVKEIRKSKNTIKSEIIIKINGFKQLARNEYARVLGYKHFTYVGPLDGLTRPFCKKHTGTFRTMKEWNSLDNGQKNPVGIYKGGYNCRHSLVGEE